MEVVKKYWRALFAILVFSFQSVQAMEKEDETVSYVFGNSTISYKEGEVKHSKKKTHLIAESYEPDTIILQRAEVYEGSPRSLQREAVQLERVLKKAKKGEDGRLHVTETTEWPYRIHGQLTMTYEDRTWGGSGVLIGPHHVLTAAHNVYDFDKKDWPTSWPTSISVRFGLNNTIAPFGTKKAVKVYTFKQWVNSGDQGYDMALLLLDSSIGRQIGWSGLLCLNDKEISKEKVTITGYPQGHSLQIEFMLYKTENLIK